MRFVHPILSIVFCFILWLYTNTLLFRQICGIFLTREKEFSKYRPKGFDSEEDKAAYAWQREDLLIDGFNEACKNIAASYMKVGDESTSAIHFRTTEKGNSTYLFYITQAWDNEDRVKKFHVLLHGSFYPLKYI